MYKDAKMLGKMALKRAFGVYVGPVHSRGVFQKAGYVAYPGKFRSK